ncbi:hypothetical protein MHU86_11781 [Fragilaria crotonensis]|nr:hypothetical protein MHU86_11781 [Fragilaria crotonensis]
MSDAPPQNWRRHGKARRKKLLRQDEKQGGTSFLLNSKLPIQEYMDVGDQALRQFHDMYETRSNMEEVYVMGHRLVAFLKHALQRHSMFDAVENYDLRAKRRQDLDWIQNRLDVVALRIDEEEWNQYILRDLDSHLSKGFDAEAAKTRRGPETQWENFSGWTPVGEGEFAWEEAHDVSFETSPTEEEDFYEDDENLDGDDEYSDDMNSGVIDYVEVEAADDEESEHLTHTVQMLEADDYSLWHITAVEESVDDSSQVEQSADRLQEQSTEVVTVNLLRRSPVKVLSDVFTSVLKRPQRQDPPGMYFSKINCFTTHRPEHYADNEGVVVKDDKENETISTAPSDEDDYYPRWRGRYEDGGGVQRLEYARESSSRFRAYS